MTNHDSSIRKRVNLIGASPSDANANAESRADETDGRLAREREARTSADAASDDDARHHRRRRLRRGASIATGDDDEKGDDDADGNDGTAPSKWSQIRSRLARDARGDVWTRQPNGVGVVSSVANGAGDDATTATGGPGAVGEGRGERVRAVGGIAVRAQLFRRRDVRENRRGVRGDAGKGDAGEPGVREEKVRVDGSRG